MCGKVCVLLVAPLHVCLCWKQSERFFSAVTKLITFLWLLLTLYSCGNVIVLVIVHFINNWFMMILVAVYVYLKINAMKSLWARGRLKSTNKNHQTHITLSPRPPFCFSFIDNVNVT